MAVEEIFWDGITITSLQGKTTSLNCGHWPNQVQGFIFVWYWLSFKIFESFKKIPIVSLVCNKIYILETYLILINKYTVYLILVRACSLITCVSNACNYITYTGCSI